MTTNPAQVDTKPTSTGIDPRSPRFGAGITAALLLAVIALSLAGSVSGSLAQRVTAPGFILFVVISALFAWGAGAGVKRHPYGALFRAVVRPRLGPPHDLEDAAAPRFAQGVGFVITVAGIILHLTGVPFAIVIAASAAFFAAFLNSVFAYCLGCQLFVLILRARSARGAAV